MRIIVVGLGIQGLKRERAAGSDFVAAVDPYMREAEYTRIEDIPLSEYDAAMVCVPYEPKAGIIHWCLEHDKHVLVEKPLWVGNEAQLGQLEALANERGLVCYTAYNHRFEPSIERMRALIASGDLGSIYSCRMFYGNGTARLVRDSWRDEYGALWEIGPHLLDLSREWFGECEFNVVSAYRHENASVDHVVIKRDPYGPRIELEMTFLSWRNTFTIDVIGANGSAHVDGLMKWGASRFTKRQRVLPSGVPPEESIVLTGADSTWAHEYGHFKHLCDTRVHCDLSNDLWMHRVLNRLEDYM